MTVSFACVSIHAFSIHLISGPICITTKRYKLTSPHISCIHTCIHTVHSNNIQYICQFYQNKVIHCQRQYSVYFPVNMRFLSTPSSRALGSCHQTGCRPLLWVPERTAVLSVSLLLTSKLKGLTSDSWSQCWTRSDHLSGPCSQGITADMTVSLCFSLL